MKLKLNVLETHRPISYWMNSKIIGWKKEIVQALLQVETFPNIK